MSLSAVYETYLPLIEAEMRSVLACPAGSVAGHYGIMGYHMGWLDAALAPTSAQSGKRIRPILCLLACAAVGGDVQGALPAAAGLELLHNFSLIHDDIEDGSPTRRHRATAWTLWGMPLACNAGDGMFSLAHLAFHRLRGRVPAEVMLEALRRFEETCLALTEGQFLDMAFETRMDVTVEDYFHMIGRKTGALLAVSPELGALLGGASAETVSAFTQYGAALGRAFQLQDDILGIWGDESITGKSAASDILSKKKSLPVVYALAHPQTGPELAKLYSGPAFTGEDIARVLALLDAAQSRTYVEAEVRRATAEGHMTLARIAGDARPEPCAALAELLESLIGRKN